MEDFLIHTRNSFDAIAHSFDEEDQANEILQWMRNTVYEIYLSNFSKGDRLLELNAGTGIDAIYLALKGIKVYATDISPEMLKSLRVKSDALSLNEFIKTKNLSFEEIDSVDETNFDGVISNFGGLNCIKNFEKVSDSLAAKVKPSGRFIASVMNSFCPWEILYYLLKLDPGSAFRRFNKDGIDAGLSQFKIKSFYFSPKEFARAFEKNFELVKIYSLGLFTPPPYLYGIYQKAKPIVEAFMKIDKAVKSVFPFNRAGDHFVIVLKRRSG